MKFECNFLIGREVLHLLYFFIKRKTKPEAPFLSSFSKADQSKLQNMAILLKNLRSTVVQAFRLPSLLQQSLPAAFHTSPTLDGFIKGPKRYETYNKTIYPPQSPEEEPRKAVRLYFFLKSSPKLNFLSVRLPCEEKYPV